MRRQNPDSIPEPVVTLDGAGESCATFTPLVAARMRELAPGTRLDVLTDDESAPEALASWARLTGNDLLLIHEEGDGRRRFLLRRKQ
jgi:TusA-related sulfurtransferase